jgi:hypothetical protein
MRDRMTWLNKVGQIFHEFQAYTRLSSTMQLMLGTCVSPHTQLLCLKFGHRLESTCSFSIHVTQKLCLAKGEPAKPLGLAWQFLCNMYVIPVSVSAGGISDL